MPVFAYVADDKAGKIIRGRFDADNEETVAAALKDSGYAVTQVALESADEAPAIRIVNTILMYAVKDGASEILIEPQPNFVAVSFCIDGEWNESMRVPRCELAPLVSRLKLMANLDTAERHTLQEGRIHIQMHDKDYDLRVSTHPTQHGEKVAIHIMAAA